MKTIHLTILAVLLCILPARTLQGQSTATNRVRISELPTTNSLQWSNIIAAVVFPYPHPNYTNGTMGINASNLAVSISPWITGVSSSSPSFDSQSSGSPSFDSQ